ncbi:MFS transporter [Vagococcus acidifermentans]|uniref:MFS transporter n=1 Tax=Vagococcus acidifermentans TaxID=564710 RepID=A0A430AQL7_9ENTE|nr:MFS transporter [Vagococcus acidifermentans]RSU10421.1 hypothetical protein CBF27_10415 [Vagococcus acidifermentans]
MNLLVSHRNFRNFFFLSTTSLIADSIYYIVLTIYASQLSNPALAIGLITLSENLPYLFNPLSGAIADNTADKYTVLKRLVVMRAVLYSVVAVLIMHQSMAALAAICLINLVSDLSGRMFNGLLSPYIPFVLEKERLEEAQELIGSNAQIISIIASFLGAMLIGFLSFSQVAVINVGLFMLALLIVMAMKTSLLKFQSSVQVSKMNTAAVFKHLTTTFKMIAEKKVYLLLVIQFTFINGILGLLVPFSTNVFRLFPALHVLSFPFTLAFYQGLFSLGIIVSGLFLMRYVKKVTVIQLIGILYGLLVVQVFFLMIQFKAGIFITALVAGLLLGFIGPKMSYLMYDNFSSEVLGAVGGTLNFIYMIGPVITSFIFTLISATKKLSLMFAFFWVILAIGIVFSLYITKKEKIRNS